MAASVEDAVKSMILNLEQKTSRKFGEWLQIARTSGRAKHGEVVAFLKAEHGLGHGYANLVAHQAKGSDSVSEAAAGKDLVSAQYAGKKAGLRPIYDAIEAKIAGFGKDIELSPKKTYVSLRRSKQFGIVQPSTADRVDVGLNLKGVAPKGRLEAAGSFNSMVTHRVRLSSVKDVDADLVGWLRRAYESA